jgi:hypothetical protein
MKSKPWYFGFLSLKGPDFSFFKKKHTEHEDTSSNGRCKDSGKVRARIRAETTGWAVHPIRP